LENVGEGSPFVASAHDEEHFARLEERRVRERQPAHCCRRHVDHGRQAVLEVQRGSGREQRRGVPGRGPKAPEIEGRLG
jgi:hypothetical protein